MKWQSDDYYYSIPATVQDAHKEVNQISAWRKQDAKTLNLVLLKLLKDANPQSSEMQLRLRADTIKSKYWYFKIGEVAMVLRNGLTGKYGNIPSGADPVLFWLEKYDTTDRVDHFEAINKAYKESNERYFEERERAEIIDFRIESKKELKRLQAKEEAQKKLT